MDKYGVGYWKKLEGVHRSGKKLEKIGRSCKKFEEVGRNGKELERVRRSFIIVYLNNSILKRIVIYLFYNVNE